jgi:hypothetical protein
MTKLFCTASVPSLFVAASLSVTGLASTGCSTSATLSSFEGATRTSWPELHPGSKVLISTAKSCKAVRGDTLEDVFQKDAKPYEALSGQLVTVVDSYINPDVERFGLRVDLGDGKTTFIGVPFEGPSCLYSPDVPGLERANALLGQPLVFAPWREDCQQVFAIGQSPNALLFDAEPGGELKPGKLFFLPVQGTIEAPVPWLMFAEESLAVPLPVVDRCFVPPSSDQAKPPKDVRASLRLSPSQCAASDYKGKPHLECQTSLGTWRIDAGPAQVNAVFQRRTMGNVHFLGDRMVDGEAFARVVVALELGQATEPRLRALYDAMTSAVRSTMTKEGAARVTVPGDPAATVAVSLRLDELSVGELERSETTEQSTYKDHQEDRPNPKKAEKEAEADHAEGEIPGAESELQNAEQELKDSQERQSELIRSCKEEASKAGKYSGLAGVGCNFADMLTRPQGRVSEARQALANARRKASEARAEARREPATTREWVMMPWPYKRTAYKRTVSVVLDMSVTPKGAPAQTSRAPLRLDLTDYEVAADPKHNVEGHAPDPNLVKNPDALAARIAEQVSRKVSGSLRAILTREERAAAARLLAEAGIEVSREEHQAVDAAAFAAVGRRIVKAERRGSAKGPDTPLPTSSVPLEAEECLLVVAVAEEPSTAAVIIRSADGSVVDDRKRSTALVEMCPRKKGSPPPFKVDLPAGGTARWAVYRLK